MKKFEKLEEKILKEVVQFLKNTDFNLENLTFKDNEKLRESLEDFISNSFLEYERKNNVELMYEIFINRQNKVEVEILEV